MNKSYTKIIWIAIAYVLLLSACAGTSNPNPSNQVNVGTLMGPTGMGLAQLMARSQDNLTENNYNFTIAGTPEEITAGLISGEFDIATLPANVASVLYNATDGDVKMIALNTLGLLFVLDATGTIDSIESLRGKTINITGQGAIPQFAFYHILRGNGLEPGYDVEIIYNAEHTELASLMVAGDVSVGLLPQPFVTTVINQNDNINIALDLTTEWEAINPGSTFVQGSVVVRTEFLEQNPSAVNSFLQDQAESVAFVNSNVEEASQLIGGVDIIPAPIALQAIPKSNLVHITGTEMQLLVQAFLKVMFEANPQSIGGAMPDEDFFFTQTD